MSLKCPYFLAKFQPHVLINFVLTQKKVCTGHRPFGAAALLSLYIFTGSLPAGHRVPLTMCNPWMTSYYRFIVEFLPFYYRFHLPASSSQRMSLLSEQHISHRLLTHTGDKKRRRKEKKDMEKEKGHLPVMA